MLEIINLHKHFGKQKVLNGINLVIEKGERHSIIGPNGAGKSTLFNVITGRYSPSQGKIIYKGKNISRHSPFRICRSGLNRSFQIINIFEDMTVYENIRSAVLAKHKKFYDFISHVDRMKQIEDETVEIIRKIGLFDKMQSLAGEMSHGFQRALEIGITIAPDPELLLLDEPGAGTSADDTKKTVELIKKVTEGKTLVVIEHDMDVVFALSDRISVLYYGEIIATDIPEKIRTNKRVKEIYLGEENGA